MKISEGASSKNGSTETCTAPSSWRKAATTVFEFLFAEKDRANIDEAELRAFRKLAKAYDNVNGGQLAALVAARELTEICHGDKT